MSARDWILRRLISMLLTASLHSCTVIGEPAAAPVAQSSQAFEQMQSQALPARSSRARCRM